MVDFEIKIDREEFERAVDNTVNVYQPEALKKVNQTFDELIEFVKKHGLRHANLFKESAIGLNEVALLYEPIHQGFKVIVTKESDLTYREYEEFYKNGNKVRLIDHDFADAIQYFKEKLVELNSIDDDRKRKYAKPINAGNVCHPLFCYMCDLKREIDGSTILKKQEHKDGIYFETPLCEECKGSANFLKPEDLFIPLTTPAGTGGNADQISHRYYIDFTAGIVPKILDLRRISDSGEITEDCYILTSEMIGSSLFRIKNAVNKFACFVGNPVYVDLYGDYINDKKGAPCFYDRCGYPAYKFGYGKELSDIIFLNKETIDANFYAALDIMWPEGEHLKYHNMDLWK